MTFLTGKTILIVSPGEWGKVMVSKHHYAIELARAGNRVFFINPPVRSGRGVRIEAVEAHPGIHVVTFSLNVPFALRFHGRRIYEALLRRAVGRVLDRIQAAPDIVWCFDVNSYADLRMFGAPLSIFHPVDEISEHQVEVARSADLCLTVSESILRTLRKVNPNSHKISHGLARPFAAAAHRELANLSAADGAESKPRSPFTVGYVGNLLIHGLDRPALRRVITGHSDVEFEFWGPFESGDAARYAPGSREFVDWLKGRSNVTLHGTHPPEVVAEQMPRCDAFLVCYDRRIEPNQGSNAHKILEYLSSGTPVISSHSSEYADKPGLLEMLGPHDPPECYDALFAGTLARLSTLSSSEQKRRRIEFALESTYERQLARIDSIILVTVGAKV